MVNIAMKINKNSCNDCQININGQNDTYQNIYVGQNVICDSNNGMPVKLINNMITHTRVFDQGYTLEERH